jgi:Ca2+-binding EF-hand superfamily protein
MKTIPVSLLIAGLMLPVIAVAQPEKDERPEKGPRGGPRGERGMGIGKGWKEADSDGDGKITQAEFQNLPRIQKLEEERRSHIFNRLDKNGDKVLNSAELSPGERPPQERREAMMRFKALDTDNSGGVSLEELKNGELFKKLPVEKQETLFRRLDTDGDGQITVRDRPERPPGGPDKRMDRPGKPDREGDGPDREGRKDKGRDPKRMLRDLDGNADGAVDFEEFRQAPPQKDLTEDEQEDRFEALDKNGDKKLDPADFPPPPKAGDGPPPPKAE